MVPKPILICFFRDVKYITFPVVKYTSLFINLCSKSASGTETYSHMLLKRFQVFYFYSCELYITVHKYVVPKVLGCIKTYSQRLLLELQVYYFSNCELYITVHKMWYKRCQWYRNPFSYASLEISSILLFQL